MVFLDTCEKMYLVFFTFNESLFKANQSLTLATQVKKILAAT